MLNLQKFPDLIHLFNKNNISVKSTILNKLTYSPSTSDGNGYVYGFFSPIDRNLRTKFWMKLGRTARFNPFKRVDEWGGDMIFCQKSPFNKKFAIFGDFIEQASAWFCSIEHGTFYIRALSAI